MWMRLWLWQQKELRRSAEQAVQEKEQLLRLCLL
jgi:hypothetical protein